MNISLKAGPNILLAPLTRGRYNTPFLDREYIIEGRPQHSISTTEGIMERKNAEMKCGRHAVSRQIKIAICYLFIYTNRTTAAAAAATAFAQVITP